MVQWSVYRENDGPMKAVRFLGDSLANERPSHAEDLVESMAAAIVRNTVANSGLMEIIQDRNTLRKTIMDGLKPKLADWGIWIESAEITDVKISSSTLFKQLQCEFRDTQYETATKMKVENEHTIKLKELEVSEQKKTRNIEVGEKTDIDLSAKSIVKEQMRLEKTLKDLSDSFAKFELTKARELTDQVHSRKLQIEAMQANFKIEAAQSKEEIDRLKKEHTRQEEA